MIKKRTVRVLSWERMLEPELNYGEFAIIRSQAGLIGSFHHGKK
jgi:hypothetical protein